MRKILAFFVTLMVIGCGAVKKKTTYSKTRKVTVAASPSLEVQPGESYNGNTPIIDKASKAQNIINTALQFSGVKYKYGGTTHKGMDCSGLLYVAFGENNVPLPRISYQMAEQGKRINIKNVNKGDLLFFRTGKRGKRINHVGLVVEVGDEEIKFIHASTTRGVIVSSLREGYWNYAFVKATRVL